MVKAKDSWLCKKPSDWDAPNVDRMENVLPCTKQSFPASGFNPFMFSANAPFPGFPIPGLRGSYDLSSDLPPLVENSLSPPDPYIKEPQSAFAHKLGVETMANNVTSSNQRSYIICDQSDDLVRFFLSSFGSSTGKLINSPIKPVHVSYTCEVEQMPITEQIIPTDPKIQGACDDNQIVVEESEFHEDSEEINALLYSDDDYDYNDDEEDVDGEVTSTDRSPSKIDESLHNYEQVGDMIEEVATSDGSTKRQRLLDGGYKKSLVVELANSGGNDRSRDYNNDMESSCACLGAKGNVMSSNLGTKRPRNDKIHETLTILENIIPGGLKSKEPTLIIDEAINYLKSLKLKAKALGLAYP